MRRGDISASPAPRMLFVWEGLIARLPDPVALRKRDRALKRRRWREALDCYATDAVMAARVQHLVWNYDFGLDLVTYLPGEVLPVLKERLDAERSSFGWVTANTIDEIAQRVSWDQSVARIFDADPARVVRYGPKGCLVTDPRTTDLLH